MHQDDLQRLEDAAKRTLHLKQTEAEKGHDWVVDAHSLTSCSLLELVALAKIGWPIWKNSGTDDRNSKFPCQNDACEWHRRGRHTHPDGTILSPPIFS